MKINFKELWNAHKGDIIGIGLGIIILVIGIIIGEKYNL